MGFSRSFAGNAAETVEQQNILTVFIGCDEFFDGDRGAARPPIYVQCWCFRAEKSSARYGGSAADGKIAPIKIG